MKVDLRLIICIVVLVLSFVFVLVDVFRDLFVCRLDLKNLNSFVGSCIDYLEGCIVEFTLLLNETNYTKQELYDILYESNFSDQLKFDRGEE